MGNQITSFKPKAQPDSGRKKKGLSVADPSGSASNLQLQADLPCVKDPGCECWLCARCPCCLCQQDRDAIRYRERRGLLGLGGHRHTTGAAVCLCQLCQLDSQNQFWVGLRNLTVPVPQKSAGTASRPTSSGRSWRSRLSALFRRCLPRPNPGPGPDSKDDLADVYSQTPKCDIPEGDNVSYESWGTIWDDETDDEDQVNSGTDYDNVAGEGTSVADISLDQGMGEKASLAEGMEEDAHEPEEEEEGEAKREDFDFYF